MGKRGPKPKTRKIEWNRDLAYAVGLLATDGSLSNSGRHIIFVSKDRQQIRNLMHIFKLRVKIGYTVSGYSGRKTPRIQFGDVVLYRFLLRIGLTTNKSKTLGTLKVPPQYFFDFLRGVFDGDGSTYSYWDKRWKSSFMFYVCFASASPAFINWLRSRIERFLRVRGHVTHANGHNTYQLKYAKRDGLVVIKRMYAYPTKSLFLPRKHLKIRKMLAIVGEQL